MFLLDLFVMEILPICRDLEILYDDVYFGDVWLKSAATVEKSYICMLFEFSCVDVASISWIFILFACIIALIEIGCYGLYKCRGRWDVSNLVDCQVAPADRTVILTCEVLLSQLIIGVSLLWLTARTNRTLILTCEVLLIQRELKHKLKLAF